MSELFDKQSECIKREFEVNLLAFTQGPASPQKACNENKSRSIERKNNGCLKYF